jgi:hypothetical protein
VADGYNVAFGDFSDPRIWKPVALHGRKVTVLTAPLFEVSRELGPAVRQLFPDLKRIAVVRSQEEAERFRSIGVLPVIDRSAPSGLDLAALVLAELGVPDRQLDAPPAGARALRQGCRSGMTGAAAGSPPLYRGVRRPMDRLCQRIGERVDRPASLRVKRTPEQDPASRLPTRAVGVVRRH